MRKVIMGSTMFLAGLISVAVMLSGSMANDGTVNGQHSAWWNLTQYGLMPVLYIFAGIAAVGLLIALWGLFKRKTDR